MRTKMWKNLIGRIDGQFLFLQNNLILKIDFKTKNDNNPRNSHLNIPFKLIIN